MAEASPQSDPRRQTTPLFRTEAVEHARIKEFGTVIITSARQFRVITFILVCIVLLMIVLAFLVSTTSKAEARGTLVPKSGMVQIFGPYPGLVIERRVSDGAKVSQGDALFVISGEVKTSTNEMYKTISRSLENRRNSLLNEIHDLRAIERLKSETRERRTQELQQERKHIAAQMQFQNQRISLAKQSLERYEYLMLTKFISAAQLDQKQSEFLDQRQRLVDLERLLSNTTSELANIKTEIGEASLQLGVRLGALTREVASLEEELAQNEARREYIVRAPRDGIVTSITAQPGQQISSSVSIAVLLPEGEELEAEIYASSRSIGFVEPGMNVELRYHAYPYQKFGFQKGYVREVSDAPVPALELPHSRELGGEPMYRIRIVLAKQQISAYGRETPLKAGMLVDASLELEPRKLYERILDPIWSISGRM